ncbi:cytochrome P450 [Mycena belliarum]|uniref:Cytochrome P450 n=1 Tax=Mycena belliarum TaxID=1033014 RepID=A0AAD6UGX8_9AGAR|nr:cytochrome P450 [Mycena belliae]
MPEFLLSEEYGEHEFRWQQVYGPVYSIKGCFGSPRLVVSDPIAAKHILNSPVFEWGPTHRKIANILFGYGNIFLAQGERHRHLRNIMNPWFSAHSVRASLPVIQNIAKKAKFSERTVNIFPSLSDAVLDVIGEAILEYPFDALEGKSKLSGIQRTMIDSATSRTKIALLVDAVLGYLPEPVLSIAAKLPLMRQKRENEASEMDRSFIGQFVQPKYSKTQVGVPDKEIAVHLRTILFAGSDTTASLLGWVLYKLAQMEDFQGDLRTEIQLAARDGPDIDYDKMPLLNAMINEVLRLYTPLPFIDRVATDNCVLPLSQPITTTTGATVSEIPLLKGQRLYLSLGAYNRLTSLWGADAYRFRPSRWLENEPCKGPALGPYASLLTFLGGPTVCLGWRFAYNPAFYATQ